MTSHDDGGDDDGDDDDPFRFKMGLPFFVKWSLIPGINCYAIYAHVPTTMMMMMVVVVVMMMMMTTMMMMMMTTTTIVIAIAMTCYDLLFFCHVKSDARRPWLGGLTFGT